MKLLIFSVCQLLRGAVVPRRGLEPPRLAAQVPETCASTNSAIWAFGWWAIAYGFRPDLSIDAKQLRFDAAAGQKCRPKTPELP